MTTAMSRREFLAAGSAGAAGVLGLPSLLTASQGKGRAAEIMVGITSNTSPEWNGQANFLRAMDEAAEVGFRWIEIFPRDMGGWLRNPEGFRDELEKRGLGLITVSGGGDFTDPAQRDAVLASNMEIVDFLVKFGCGHLKLNIGGYQPRAVTQEPAVYRQIAGTLNELGRRTADVGVRFGIHPHLSSPIETREDTDAIMELTDPDLVYLVMDAGDRTMAGMDPVRLTRDYLPRVIEIHLKDVHRRHRGGNTGPPVGRLRPPASQRPVDAPEFDLPAADLPASVRYRDRDFCELGCGGVDFPAILAMMNEASWKGWFTVELNSTVTTAKASATVSREYIERVLRLQL